MDQIVSKTSGKTYQSATFGVFIILVVFVPIMRFTDIKGKIFPSMTQTVRFSILDEFLLSLTYVPVMLAIIANKNI
ncbi:MAG: efflux RND transporter permease subunit [Flavobacteriales bacterium AspAUS03]